MWKWLGSSVLVLEIEACGYLSCGIGAGDCWFPRGARIRAQILSQHPGMGKTLICSLLWLLLQQIGRLEPPAELSIWANRRPT